MNKFWKTYLFTMLPVSIISVLLYNYTQYQVAAEIMHYSLLGLYMIIYNIATVILLVLVFVDEKHLKIEKKLPNFSRLNQWFTYMAVILLYYTSMYYTGSPEWLYWYVGLTIASLAFSTTALLQRIVTLNSES